MPKYRVAFRKSGALFIPSEYAAKVVLDECHDVDASTEENVIVEYTIAPEYANYFESLLENSDGVQEWDKVLRWLSWYDNGSDPTGRPYWEAGEWVEAVTYKEAIAKAKTGCLWTQVIVTCGAHPDDDPYLQLRSLVLQWKRKKVGHSVLKNAV